MFLLLKTDENSPVSWRSQSIQYWRLRWDANTHFPIEDSKKGLTREFAMYVDSGFNSCWGSAMWRTLVNIFWNVWEGMHRNVDCGLSLGSSVWLSHRRAARQSVERKMLGAAKSEIRSCCTLFGYRPRTVSHDEQRNSVYVSIGTIAISAMRHCVHAFLLCKSKAYV
jgi:hypothetical protein